MNDTAFWMGISQNIHFHLFFAAFFVFNYCLHDQEWNPIASSSAVSARLRFFCLSFFVWMIGHLLVLRIHWMKTWIFLEMFESCKMVAWYAQVFYHKNPYHLWDWYTYMIFFIISHDFYGKSTNMYIYIHIPYISSYGFILIQFFNMFTLCTQPWYHFDLLRPVLAGCQMDTPRNFSTGIFSFRER